VYINTESAFPSKRLVELTEHFKNRFKDLLSEDPMSQIIIEQVKDSVIEKRKISHRNVCGSFFQHVVFLSHVAPIVGLRDQPFTNLG